MRPKATLLFIKTNAPYAALDLRAAKSIAQFIERELKTVNAPLSFDNSNPIIPNRNLFLYATATAAGFRELFVSHPLEDLVPDASPRFLRASSAVLSASLGEEVIVSNALAGETKASALRKLLALQEDPKALVAKMMVRGTRSCYSADETHCGTCSACFKRWVAFTLNGIEQEWQHDPRGYLGTLLSKRGSLSPRKWRYVLEVLRALRV